MSFVDSLLVTLVGMAVVFLGLFILICFIKLMNLFRQDKPKKAVQAPAQVHMEAPPAQINDGEAVTMDIDLNDDPIIAVITAAIAAAWGDSETGFVVRRVRRVENAPAWQRAARSEQAYSRM